MQVKDIIERASLLYNDVDYARVSEHQYLQFLDDAIVQVIMARPDAHTMTRMVELRQGPRQTLPDEAYSLIDIPYNVVATTNGVGYTYSSPIRKVEQNDLDSYGNWAAQEPSSEIMEFCYDAKTPRSFMVNPPAVAGTTVEMQFSYEPESYASYTKSFVEVMEYDLPLPSIYRSALVDYMLYLLYSTDSTSSTDRAIAAAYESSFLKQLATQGQSAEVVAPRTNPVQKAVMA